MHYGIIGGTGFEAPFSPAREEIMTTPYGEAKLMYPEDKPYVFVSRHGTGHNIPPHVVPYKANIWALHEIGVTEVYGISAVGSLKKKYAPNDVVLTDDFLDFTKTRPSTFYDGTETVAKHIAMDAPYDEELNRLFEEAYGEKLPRGIYVTTEGPRFESRAEIRFYASIGGDVVGMTNVPEVVLAKEMGMYYANICHVVNYCTGVAESLEILPSARIREKIVAAVDAVFTKKTEPRAAKIDLL
ncbi:S-methyl-5'-thioadenosine phosphorylase [Aedoeadaptatus ivorii]|uniref:Purine nucleoside phosphorylase n=1 Tax=Aedoeadaptatus ivorii TaxID=54006 RepID=A0A448V192_9FIRM|nr:MTAP family purine nucleoside phosphorylase [Peptoniphilus ivorii]MDQ0507734.1 5'-methylthioadenosine phosphorylase [Peptoniphilus ivorii]VEJ35505.1 S-methyl-5'-thioadenosine phosphorylase [Peptoniphilus ivorii]